MKSNWFQAKLQYGVMHGMGKRPVRRKGRQRGYILLATGIAAIAVMAMTGLAVDVGRIYIAKNEAQTFVDTAAIAAAIELDGTLDGFDRANAAVAGSTNRWNFGHNVFTSTTVEFSTNQSGPWEASPMTAPNYRFVRIKTDVDVPKTFIRVVSDTPTQKVAAFAVAGQVTLTNIHEGACPFSPYAHDSTPPDFGLTRGGLHTLRWASSPSLKKHKTLCQADATQEMIDVATMVGDERGYIEETSSDVIRKSILYNYQTVTRSIGDSVLMTGGSKATIAQALNDRVAMDTDQTAVDYAHYDGNGSRLFICPINNGPAYGNVIVEFGLFFLQTGYSQGGNDPMCGEYIGSGVMGSNKKGASEQPGFYVVRLTQ